MKGKGGKWILVWDGKGASIEQESTEDEGEGGTCKWGVVNVCKGRAVGKQNGD